MLNQQNFEQLVSKLETYKLLSTIFKNQLRTCLDATYFRKGIALTQPNKIPSSAWFILSGSVERQVKNLNTGVDEIRWFWQPGDWVFTVQGFFSRQHSNGTILVRENSVLIPVSYGEYTRTISQFPETADLSDRIRDAHAAEIDSMLYDLAHLTKEELYLKFKKNHRSILFSSSQYKLAAFLGMSYRTFHRLHKLP